MSGYNMGYLVGQALGLIIALALYFLPAWLGRNKQPSTPILVLNLLLGWTLLGWVAALIWAIAASKKPSADYTSF